MVPLFSIFMHKPGTEVLPDGLSVQPCQPLQGSAEVKYLSGHAEIKFAFLGASPMHGNPPQLFTIFPPLLYCKGVVIKDDTNTIPDAITHMCVSRFFLFCLSLYSLFPYKAQHSSWKVGRNKIHPQKVQHNFPSQCGYNAVPCFPIQNIVS